MQSVVAGSLGGGGPVLVLHSYNRRLTTKAKPPWFETTASHYVVTVASQNA